MQHAIVRSGDLGNRWDARFHIALDQVRDRVGTLRETVTADQARERLGALPLSVLAPLAVLKTERGPGLKRAEADRVISAYPHLALAIMERNLRPAVEAIRAEISERQEALARLVAISETAIVTLEANLSPEERDVPRRVADADAEFAEPGDPETDTDADEPTAPRF